MKVAFFPVLFAATIVPLASEAASLRGSPQKAELQNRWADRAGIKSIRSEKELAELKKLSQLVPLPVAMGVAVDDRLAPEFRFCRPEVRTFLGALGKSFSGAFASSFRVTSAVRTVTYQKTLQKDNLNAAETSGPKASSHLRGTTIDITKIGLAEKQIQWLRKHLGDGAAKGRLIVVEEFQQAVFHVMVRPAFGMATPAKAAVPTATKKSRRAHKHRVPHHVTRALFYKQTPSRQDGRSLFKNHRP